MKIKLKSHEKIVLIAAVVETLMLFLVIRPMVGYADTPLSILAQIVLVLWFVCSAVTFVVGCASLLYVTWTYLADLLKGHVHNNTWVGKAIQWIKTDDRL